MRTTLDIDDHLLREAEQRAAEDGETLTCVLEKALRHYLKTRRTPGEPFRLHLLTKKGRAIPGLNWENRDSFYERMDGR